MQNPHDVLKLAKAIACLGFTTGGYANAAEIDIRWVCFAAYGPHRRYFTVSDSHTMRPTINLLDCSESEKSIDKVDPNKVVDTIAFQDLVSDSFSGVVRGLGLYKVLTERGSLKLTDFKPLNLTSPKPFGWTTVMIYHFDSLEMADGIMSGNQMTSQKAQAEAKRFNGGGMYFTVVIDHQGNPVAVYYRGEQIA